MTWIAIVLVFQEGAFRLFFPLPEIRNFNRVIYPTMGDKDRRFYVRNIDVVWKSSLDTPEAFVNRLNNYGFRDRDWQVAKRTGTQRIAIVGDSFVEGIMARDEETIPRVFEQELTASDSGLEIMNMGIMGVGLLSYMNLIVDTVPIFRPDHLIVVLYSNDVPSQDNAVARPPITPQYDDRFRPRLLELLAMTSRKEPLPQRWLRRRRGYYYPVPYAHNPWTNDEATLSAQVTPRVAEAMKKAEFNYFRTCWVLKEEAHLKTPTELTAQFKFLQEYTQRHGGRLYVVYIPSRHQVSRYYYRFEKEVCLQGPDGLDMTQDTYQIHAGSVARSCQALQVPFRDLTSDIRKAEEAGEHLYWDYDDHMRGKGYALVGKKMAAWWQRVRQPVTR